MNSCSVNRCCCNTPCTKLVMEKPPTKDHKIAFQEMTLLPHIINLQEKDHLSIEEKTVGLEVFSIHVPFNQTTFGGPEPPIAP